MATGDLEQVKTLLQQGLNLEELNAVNEYGVSIFFQILGIRILNFRIRSLHYL